MNRLWMLFLAAALVGCSAHETETPPSAGGASQEEAVTEKPVSESRVQLEEIKTGKDGRSEFKMEIDISEPDGRE